MIRKRRLSFSKRRLCTGVYLNPGNEGFKTAIHSPALVVEQKYDKSAETALQQIKDRKYAQALEGYSGEILLVGVNYDKDNADNPHCCVIEKLRC